jgi:hypothetical protein
MKRAWLLGIGAALSCLLLDPSRGVSGHPHAAAKESHEAPKHTGGKPPQHAAPKPQNKPLPKAQGKSQENRAHQSESNKSTGTKHQSNPNQPNANGSVAKNHHPNANGTTNHHGHHHEWHHDRWWHGHHHIWSEEGYWVDAGTGLPVVAADAGPAVVATGGTSGASGLPQVHFSVDPSQREAYDAAAQAAGMSRADWIRSRLDAALGSELK